MNKLIDLSDKAAIALSCACVLHCILVPILMLALPWISSLIDDQVFHFWMAFAVIPLSLLAMGLGYFHHRRLNVLLICLVGMLILVMTAIYGHDHLGETGEVIATLFGSGIIAFGHVRNFKLRRTQPCTKPIEISH
jgi:hypothetical protein